MEKIEKTLKDSEHATMLLKMQVKKDVELRGPVCVLFLRGQTAVRGAF